ncbi:MAG: (2,3-dihydroxybenzoyl)adenylate synthase [Candidatus Binataceae bacterium]
MLEGCTPYPPEFVERYVREGYWRAETIPQAIATIANRIELTRPDAVAVADGRRRLSFRQLADDAAAVAALLERIGLHRGDRIVIQLPNCNEFASLLLGCLEAGVVPVLALPAFRRAELEYLADFSRSRAVAIAPQFRGFDHAALARDLREAVPSLEMILSTERSVGCVSLAELPADFAPLGSRENDPFDVAFFLLSGGTTGLPKLIARLHTEYLYNARESSKACGVDGASRMLIALPVEHNFPLGCPGMMGALLNGATTIFAQTTQPAELASIAAREGATHLPCVPTLALGLIELHGAARESLSALRIVTVGGQKLQEPTAAALKRAYPHVTVQQVLGMAEGLLCYTRLDDPEAVAFNTQGRPLSTADEIRIVDDAGNDVAEGHGGELWCRGPYTLRGYYRASERNRDAFTADGFYKTGDLVRRDPSGSLIVDGRVKDLINRGGEKISAEDIESHLLAHPAVARAAVVAMSDAVLGEKGCAYVTLRSGATLGLDALRDFLAARGVAKFKWPERLEIISEMPLTNVGKVRKIELRADIATKLAGERAGS